ncbi:MAG: hypothetical protein ACLUFW_10960 [Alistipes sp.]
MELTNTSPDKRRLFGRWFARRITTYLVVCAFLAFVNSADLAPLLVGGMGRSRMGLNLGAVAGPYLTDCDDENNYR